MRRRFTQRLCAGFSLVEVMVAAGILTIGVAALLRLFTSTQTSTKWNRDAAVAAAMGQQRIEFLTAQADDTLPTCTGTVGCKESLSAFAAALDPDGSGYPCTEFVDGPSAETPTGGTANLRYRVDTIVEAHPDATRLPSARIVTISVCWQDNGQVVREFQAQRIVVPGA